ncbi:MAG: peptide chain release factor N(5)-glutamine methyltransferase [Ruminococcaceae bacterium]|jgi:release factor glutamine methyltransferase|nr:peptide chain release factor N(5)-glutamine methyltransferase [Oscillospiraceae bacterium]
MTLDAVTARLKRAGIEPDAARHEAMLLIERFCGVSSASILADRGRDYGSPELEEAVEKRERRIPLQYILGTWEFCGLPFRVTEDCLIPRPDTEVVAERAAELLPSGGRFLDLCTGSGCVAGAVLALTKERGTSGAAVELMPKTAALARENLEHLGFSGRCPVLTGDLRDLTLLPPPTEEGSRFDVIVSNPPYVTAEEMEQLEPEVLREPRIALTDEGDGLSLIRAIVGLYPPYLKETGVLLIEHGWRQAEAVRRIAEEAGLGWAPVYDYGGRVRAGEMRRMNAERFRI